MLYDPNEFFIDGHHCRIECVGREHWKGYFDGEEFLSRGNPHTMREQMETEARYSENVTPDFEAVCRAVFNYVDQLHGDGTNEYEWVLFSDISETVTDNSSHTLEAMYTLERVGLIRFEEVGGTGGPEFVLQPTDGAEWTDDVLDDAEPLLGWN